MESTRVRLVPAVLAGTVGAAVFFVIYYVTLGLVPQTFVALPDYHPVSAWNQRLDLAQFFGCLVVPPNATEVTWWLGAALLAGLLVSSGVVFALLCSWSLAKSTPVRGTLFGFALFFFLASAVSLGSGYNPAVMRDTLPDVGFFYLGWTGWATLQLLLSLTLYGWTVGISYSRFTTAF